MSIKNKKQILPKWFDGVIYEKGDIVKNPFSGDSIKLTAKELSMYDFIMGANFFLEMTTGRQEYNSDVLKELTKGLDWFRKNNSKAYMVLLD